MSNITLWIFSLLIVLAPLLAGLYFPNMQALYFVLTSVFAFLTIRNKDDKITWVSNKPLGFLFMALVACYAISLFMAPDKLLAFSGIIKWAFYFLVFWLVGHMVNKKEDIFFILNAFYVAGIVTAIISILGATKIIDIDKVFLSKRLFSTFQYPNTFAAYSVALFIIGLYLWASSGRTRQYLYSVGNYFLIIAIIAAGSRGVMMLFPLVVGIYFICMPALYRKKALAGFMIAVTAALFANYKFLPYLIRGYHSRVWLWFCAGISVALFLQACWHYVSVKVERTRLVKWALGISIFVFFAYMFVTGDIKVVTKILPPETFKRVQSIGLDDSSAEARYELWKDGLRVVKEHPIFGLGGGAYQVAGQKYKELRNCPPHTHNDYIEIWTEVGTVGLLVCLALWGAFFMQMLKLMWGPRDKEKGFLAASIFAAVLMLGMHSFIDYDLAFGAYGMLMFGLMGIATKSVAKI